CNHLVLGHLRRSPRTEGNTICLGCKCKSKLTFRRVFHKGLGRGRMPVLPVAVSKAGLKPKTTTYKVTAEVHLRSIMDPCPSNSLKNKSFTPARSCAWKSITWRMRSMRGDVRSAKFAYTADRWQSCHFSISERSY